MKAHPQWVSVKPAPSLANARSSLRVAVVTETYPPEVNGVAATASRVVEGLCALGHHVQLFRPHQGAADAPVSTEPFSVVLVRGLPIPRYPQLKMGLPSQAALRSAWSAQAPDVVHIVTEGPLGWSALQVARQMGLPVVTDFRTNFQAYCRHYGLAWLQRPVTAYLRHFHNRAACTMVPTEALRGELAALSFKRLKVVSRGVDTRLFDPARRSLALRAEWGANSRTLTALYVGRLAAEKNLDALVAAAQALRSLDSDMRLVVVGEGPDRQRLQQLLPQAVFAGVRRGIDLATHYASADVFLFPSTTETFGNVVPEAMASGLTTVAYDHAAAGQLIRHGQNGLLARFDDTPEFCRVARSIVGEWERVREIGAKARATACGLDWGRVVEAVEAEYRVALSASAAATNLGWQPAVPVV